ncbi:kinesin-like protein KIF13B isoform X2 [Sycon ciliatum]|uniref:kinesin-like protein KIF13B isoform X2 n=1 Tax=Sycon ciliatum TaxID=27933 RepID=UPI0031F6EECA
MSKVKVAVRVRPMNRREVELNTSCCIDMTPQQTFLEHAAKGQKKFNFDYCFWSMDAADPKFSSQQQVFECLGADILDNAFDGYNACIFAYGQTGSGKSYTMMGTPSDKGVIPKLCDTIFDRIKAKQEGDPRLTCKVEVSYMEIYNEKVRDLLGAHNSKHNLRVREHKVLGPYVDGLSKLAVSSFVDIEKLMDDGNKARTVASTNMNEQSSRSHAVFNLLMTQTYFDPATQAGNEKVSKLSLVDLAGSERAGKTGAEGDRLKEGSNINKSLTTLGLVISNLADNAGGKRKTAFIPYRDSVLTWLLKDNLGGNSKTVMVATISPALDNYEETLSTLRYADRAKRIVNNAVVNEDANSKVIRELREEVERLRSMIGGGGLPGDAALGLTGASASEISELQDKLQISERLMKEMSLTWEQKLANTQKIAEERSRALENMGISVHKAGIALESGRFYLVNLNADPSLSEMLVYYLKDHTIVGKSGSNNQPDILLRGLGIQHHHCDIDLEANDVVIKPVQNAKTCVNGRVINEPIILCNGDRIVWGNNHFFRVSCSRPAPIVESESGEAPPAQTALVDFEFAKRELALTDMQTGDLGSIVSALEHKHTTDKQDALDEQRQLYENKLAALRQQLGSGASNAPSPSQEASKQSALAEAAAAAGLDPAAVYSEADEEADADMSAVRDLVIHANGMVCEANQLSEEMGKDTKFSVALQLPKAMLSPRPKDASQPQYEVVVNVVYKTRGTHTVWSVDKLEDKLVDMREMYDKLQDGALMGDLTSQGPDPFYELESHTLIGVANIFLDCLLYNVPLEYSPPIIDPRGETCGRLNVEIRRIAQVVGKPGEGEGETDGLKEQWELMEDDELQSGAKVAVQITVNEATGLPPALCHFVFCQYVFFDEQQAVIVPPLREASSKPPPPGKISFLHPHVCQVVVNEDFMAYIQADCLAIEVWGHRSSGFGDGLTAAAPPGGEVIAAEQLVSSRTKTLQERWMEVMRRLELWVEIQELNDNGEYAPVEVIDRPDVRTGGIYLLRQGQSRRVQVSVTPVRGSGLAPISCHSITSISMGAVVHQNKAAISLDSFQDTDLQRLRQRWSDALMRRRAYLDDQIHKIVDKKDLIVKSQGKSQETRKRDDNYRESELIDEWTQLQIERQVVLEPAPGTGVPGAPSTRHRFIPIGMELRIPTLFMDVNTSLPADSVNLIEVGDILLTGEDDLSMVELPLMHKDANESRQAVTPLMQTGEAAPALDGTSVTASWDTSIHDNAHLNMHTANMDRVYMVVKVKVKMEYPQSYVLVMRKRICLKIYKKLGFSTLVKKKLAARSDERHHCGVAYEVVYGIPKQAGMDRPSTPTNLAAVDDDGDQEIVIERYSHGMSSVQSILSLDRLRQELAVKEGLAAAGRVMKVRPVSAANTPGPTVQPVPTVVAPIAVPPGPATQPVTPDNDSENRSSSASGSSRSLAAPPLSTVGGLAPTPPLKRATRTQAQPQTQPKALRSSSPSSPATPVHFSAQPAPTTAETASPALPSAAKADNEKQTSMTSVLSEAQQDVTSSVHSSDEAKSGVGSSKELGTAAETIRKLTSASESTGSSDEVAAAFSESTPTAAQSGAVNDSPLTVTTNAASGSPALKEPPQVQQEAAAVEEPRVEPVAEPTVTPNSPPAPAPLVTTQTTVVPAAEVVQSVAEVSSQQPLSTSSSAVEQPVAPPAASFTEAPVHTHSKSAYPTQASPAAVPPALLMSSPGNSRVASPLAAPTSSIAHSSAAQRTSSEDSTTSSSAAVTQPASATSSQSLLLTADQASNPPPTVNSPDLASSSPSPTASASSPSPTQEDVASATSSASAEVAVAAAAVAAAPAPPEPAEPTEPLPKVGDLVMVDLANGYKMGVVKFVGTTDFQPGDWIGVALDQPKGKHDGSVKGTRYFKCKPKHGVFVKIDKIIKAPSLGGSSSVSSSSSSSSSKDVRRSMSPAGSAPVAAAVSAAAASSARRKSMPVAGDGLPSYARGTASSARRTRGV